MTRMQRAHMEFVAKILLQLRSAAKLFDTKSGVVSRLAYRACLREANIYYPIFAVNPAFNYKRFIDSTGLDSMHQFMTGEDMRPCNRSRHAPSGPQRFYKTVFENFHGLCVFIEHAARGVHTDFIMDSIFIDEAERILHQEFTTEYHVACVVIFHNLLTNCRSIINKKTYDAGYKDYVSAYLSCKYTHFSGDKFKHADDFFNQVERKLLDAGVIHYI